MLTNLDLNKIKNLQKKNKLNEFFSKYLVDWTFYQKPDIEINMWFSYMFDLWMRDFTLPQM